MEVRIDTHQSGTQRVAVIFENLSSSPVSNEGRINTIPILQARNPKIGGYLLKEQQMVGLREPKTGGNFVKLPDFPLVLGVDNFEGAHHRAVDERRSLLNDWSGFGLVPIAEGGDTE